MVLRQIRIVMNSTITTPSVTQTTHFDKYRAFFHMFVRGITNLVHRLIMTSTNQMTINYSQTVASRGPSATLSLLFDSSHNEVVANRSRHRTSCGTCDNAFNCECHRCAPDWSDYGLLIRCISEIEKDRYHVYIFRESRFIEVNVTSSSSSFFYCE